MYGCSCSRSKTGSPSARSGAIACSASRMSPLKQTLSAQIRRPCHSGGTNGAAGARTMIMNAVSSRGPSVVSVRYMRRNSSARSNGHAISPPYTVGPTACRRNVNEVTTPRFAPAPRTAQNRSAFSSRLARRTRPFAVTISTSSRLSTVQPNRRVR